MGSNDQIYLGAPFTNSDANPSGLRPGDVVLLDLTVNASVRRTTTANSTNVFGIIVVGGAPNSKVIVASFRGQRIRVNVSPSEVVAIGDRIVSSATPGLAKVDNVAADAAVFAVAIANKTGGSGSSVEVVFAAVGVGVEVTGTSVPTSRLLIAGAGQTGGGDLTADRTFNVIAHADGSIVVNPDSVQVGVISDAQHGNRGGGSLHAIATTSAAGFMSATDKLALDATNISFVVTNLTALAAINVTLFPNLGVRRYVTTLRAWFQLDKTISPTPDGITILAATGGGVWVRDAIADAYWSTFTFVSVDPVNGNDENAGFATSIGAADAVPLRTFGELNRRIPEAGFQEDIVCHVLDSIPDDQEDFMVLTRLRVQSYDTKFIIFGALTSAARPSLFTGTVSAYVTAVPSTNTQRRLTIAGAPGGLVGKLIQKADGTKSAFILKDLGGGSYRIKKPMTTNALTGAVGVGAEFVNGESVIIYDLPTAPIYPFPALVFTRDVEDTAGSHPSNLILSNFKLRSPDVGDRVELDVGGTSSRLLNCILVDPLIINGTNSNWSNVLFTSDTVGLGYLSGINYLTLTSCATLNTQLLLRNCALDLTTAFDVEGSSSQTAFATLHMQRGTCTITATATEIGIFNCTQGLVNSAEPSCNYITLGATSLYGTGNTVSPFYSIDVGGCRWAVRAANQFATTAAANPIVIKGLGYNFAALPISLMFSQVLIDTD